jgi:hypothetical protein
MITTQALVMEASSNVVPSFADRTALLSANERGALIERRGAVVVRAIFADGSEHGLADMQTETYAWISSG